MTFTTWQRIGAKRTNWRPCARFVGPASWDQHGGQGRLTSDNGELIVEQRPREQRRVAMFLNKLRRHAGLPTGAAAAPPTPGRQRHCKRSTTGPRPIWTTK